MFQAWAVKTRNIEANSAPSTLLGASFMNQASVMVRNASTGTDCRMSSSGISTISACRLFAASAA